MPKKNGTHTTVLCTSNQAIMSVAKSLLDEAGIKYIITGNGTEHNNSNDGTGENPEVELKVEFNKSMEARQVIADLVELDFDEQQM